MLLRLAPPGPLAGALSWPVVGGLLGLGALGTLLMRPAGFPEMWAAEVPNRMRLTYPAILGAFFGVMTAAQAAVQPGHGEGLVTCRFAPLAVEKEAAYFPTRRIQTSSSCRLA